MRNRRWGFPKGLIDPGETAIQTGLKEAWEEAGLRGNVVGKSLGRYRYEKWGEELDVEVFLMQVESTEDAWQEAEQRERRWAEVGEARKLIVGDKRAAFFEQAVALASACR